MSKQDGSRIKRVPIMFSSSESEDSFESLKENISDTHRKNDLCTLSSPPLNHTPLKSRSSNVSVEAHNILKNEVTEEVRRSLFQSDDSDDEVHGIPSVKNKFIITSDSSDDEDFTVKKETETEIKKFCLAVPSKLSIFGAESQNKLFSTPYPPSTRKHNPVVFTPVSNDEGMNSHITTLSNTKKPDLFHTPCPSSSRKYKPVIMSPDDEDEEIIDKIVSDDLDTFYSPNTVSTQQVKPFTSFNSNQVFSGPRLISANHYICEKASFLKSLSPSVPEPVAEKEALRYRKNFQKLKYELSSVLYKMFNEKIFGDKLPKDLNIDWSSQLLTTAGKFVRNKSKNFILLSSKVLDSSERLRDTLMHEMCHAAVCIISNAKNDNHGPLWKAYAVRCQMAFPEVEIPTRCHNYTINYKYNYACEKCKKTFGRACSLDTSKYRCKCHGSLKLIMK